MKNQNNKWEVSRKKRQEILFVDDDINIINSINRIFKQNHVPWSYRFAGGVDDALAILQEREVDAVIADIRMPDRDGFELLAFLRSSKMWSDIPVVVLTGMYNPGLKNKALDMGATDLLNKPIIPDDLLARIRSVLQLKHYQDIIKLQNNRLRTLVRQRTKALEATRLDIIWRLGKAAEFRNNETSFHVIRVGYYSKILAEKLGMAKEFTKMIFLTSPLHDLGKIGIPDSILLKPGSLDGVEREIMRTHCRIGQDILNPDTFGQSNSFASIDIALDEILYKDRNPFLQMAADIAGNHHEQWNGNGYPNGKKHEEISLPSRIVSICDVYDALRSQRTYKTRIAHDEVVTIMRKENALRFDPEIFLIFEQSLSDFQDIYAQYRDEYK